MLNNYFTSLIRTGSALLVGWVLSLPLAHPVLVTLGQTDLSPAAKEKLVGGLVAVLTALYYAAAHAAEKRWPQATWLLGSSKQPASYAAITKDQDISTGVLPADLDLNSKTDDYSKILDGAIGRADASRITPAVNYHVAEHAAPDEQA